MNEHMKIALFGATGKTGIYYLEMALDKGKIINYFDAFFDEMYSKSISFFSRFFLEIIFKLIQNNFFRS